MRPAADAAPIVSGASQERRLAQDREEENRRRQKVDRKDPSYLGHLVAQHVPQARLNLQQALRDIGRWDGLVANAGPVRRAAAECVLDRSSPPDAPKEVRQLMLIHQQEAQAVLAEAEEP
ncbi:unnamed protein product [Symbiodinium sp. KB8]|nr:unnamed protein product [Symbiodinium sp. KB8]